MYEEKALICSIVGLIIVLLVWRTWKFYLKPGFHPEDPKELPYWIPLLGHAIGFFQNSFSVLQSGREYFGSTGEPFAITIGGQSIYILTSADDVAELYKNTMTLSWEVFVQDLYRWIGFSNKAIESLWQPPTEQQKILNPVRILSPNEMVAEYQRRQLRPDKNMETLARSMVDHINELLQWHSLSIGQTRIRRGSEKLLSLSLIEWTSYAFIRSTTESYWGRSIFENDPSLLQTYATWERTNWKYVFQIPRFLSRDMYLARDRLVDAFTAYFRLPRSQRADAAWFVPIAEAEMRDIGLNDRDLGRAHMLQHWAINGNMHKVSFWILAHLLHTPALLKTIREETARGIVDDSPNVSYFIEHCPRLEAIYHEVLRLHMSNSLMRHVTAPTRIGGKLLQKGRNVMVPYRLLHYDPKVWGSNVSAFNPERFLHNKELARNPSYRPFGGGQHLCPGRFLAKQAIFTFVAVTLSRFDVCLDSDGGVEGTWGTRREGSSKQCFPRAEDLKPGLATLGPREGDDVIVRCSPRAKA